MLHEARKPYEIKVSGFFHLHGKGHFRGFCKESVRNDFQKRCENLMFQRVQGFSFLQSFCKESSGKKVVHPFSCINDLFRLGMNIAVHGHSDGGMSRNGLQGFHVRCLPRHVG